MSRNKEPVISNSEKKFLIKCLSEWTRLDGRAFDEFREVGIQFGRDYGSCYVSLGETKVLAQVSCEIQQPKSSRPSEGVLNINIELSPMAALHFEAGRQSDLSVQLNRLLEKCIKDSKTVDLESLCIKVNEKVWAFRVDLNVLNHEGNILDCASIAALSALAHFRRPDITFDGEDYVVHSYKQRDPIPTVLHHYPVYVSYAIFNNGEVILADPTVLEENAEEAYLTVGLNAYRELCGLHMGGKAQTNSEVILKTTRKAADRAIVVVQKIKEAVEKDNTVRQQAKNIGFENTLNFEQNIESDGETFAKSLEIWTTKGNKKKKNKKQNKTEALVEPLGEGSAALVPTDETGGTKWNVSSEEEVEMDKIPLVTTVAKKNTPQPVEITTSDSEEERVVVLNADLKTNKKKKRLKL